jgi:UDP-N-acetylglucosamine 1-carboxyvinyltransferase
MQCLQIEGGVPLAGVVSVAPSKNASLPILAATLLASAPVRLAPVPRLVDVDNLLRLLRALGVSVDRLADGQVELAADERGPCRAEWRLVRRMRASFCVLGPLLARRGRAVVPLPGGCRIGPRPVDLHLRGLEALGADVRLSHGYVVATARRLRGGQVALTGPRGPTVTGTANVLSAAVLARGVSTLHGAAIEPEIVDLGRFLQALGARIDGLGTSELVVEGVESLAGGSWRMIPDRIEAATLLLAAAITRGAITLAGAEPDHLAAVLEPLSRCAGEVQTAPGWVSYQSRGPLRATRLTARPYPGLPTDVQAQWTALMALADGTSRVRDLVFPQRFDHLAELSRLGARLVPRPNGVQIEGPAELSGAAVQARDLRAGAALVLAGLAARGQTLVVGLQHLDRGYERLDTKLRALGARVARVPWHSGSAQSAARGR